MKQVSRFFRSFTLLIVATLLVGLPATALTAEEEAPTTPDQLVRQIMGLAYEEQQSMNSVPFAVGDSLTDVEEEWGPAEDLSTVAANYWSHHVRFMYDGSTDERTITGIDDFDPVLQTIHLSDVKGLIGEPISEEEQEGMYYVTYSDHENYKVVFIFESAFTNPDPKLHMYTVELAEEEPDAETVIREQAQAIVEALKDQDVETVAEFVHPDQGVRFSPYAFVEMNHQSFTREQVNEMMDDEKLYVWGAYDGTGEAIELTPAEYYEEFIYRKDFANEVEEINFDDIEPRGNTLHNAEEIYPDAHFIEYYVPGTEEFAEMDWGSLILAFEEVNGEWYLVGVIQDQWTT